MYVEGSRKQDRAGVCSTAHLLKETYLHATSQHRHENTIRNGEGLHTLMLLTRTAAMAFREGREALLKSDGSVFQELWKSRNF